MSFKYLDPTGVGYFWYKVKSLVSTKYTKPDAGIPKSDLESSVQTTLTNADTVVTNFSNKIDKVNGATAGNIAILNATGSITDGNTSIQNVELNVDTNGHTYVDLGLPSGTLWATCNVGATNPEDYGDYYAWGETQTKQEYSWNTYQHGSSNSNITKYNVTDGKTELEPDDDVCHIVMGGDWRMPTEVQCRELIANTTYTWTTTNGVTGILLTSTVNNNTLFIPASGYINNTSITDLTIQSCIWSSNLYIHETYGIMGVSELSYRETGSLIVINNDRCKGYPCRGIINKSGIQFKQGKTIMPVKTTASAVEFPDGETALSKVSDLEENKVDKVSGKSLSTNDYTTEDKTKLSNIASEAQVNVLETVKVNDNPLTITNKSVNIDLSNYAQKDGSYSGMTVGAAEDLVSAESVASEFTSRITGGSTAVGKGGTALVDKIKGRTLVWNQLVQKNWFPTSSGSGLTLTNNGDGTYTINGTSESNYRFYAYTGRTSWGDHKYYCALSDSNLKMYFDGSPSNAGNTLQKQIITANASNTYFPILYFPNGSSYANLRFTVIIIDLTLMFGAGNEPSTVADFEALYPLPYYAYNPGELINNGLQSEYDLVWNQLADDSSLAASGTTNGITFTKSGHVISVTGTASNTAFSDNAIGLYLVSLTSGHKYYLGRNLNFAASLDTCYIQLYSASLANWAATSIGAHGNIFTAPSGATTATDIRMRVRVNSGTVISSSSPLNCTLQLYDLTTMFGAGNEPTTPEEFEAMFPADYYPYETGTEQHSSFPQFKTAIETVGFNQWDEEWEVGAYENGIKITDNSCIRSKNYIRVLPNTSYYIKFPAVGRVSYYNAAKTFLTSETGYNTTKTTPNDCYYITFHVSSTTKYANDICISLSDPSRNGTYEPYWRSELELGLGDIKVKSHNIWDEQWSTDGSSRVIPSNNISVSPSTTYYFKISSNTATLDYLDANGATISSAYNVGNSTFTTPANCAFLKFTVAAAYGSTYKNDICINLSDPAFNGRYEPYGDGGVITIQGGLRSSLSHYDEIVGDKYIKRNEQYTFNGTEAWGKISNLTVYRLTAIQGLNDDTQKPLATKYTSVAGSNGVPLDGCIKLLNGVYGLAINDSTYSTNDAFKASLTANNLSVVIPITPIEYELAEAIPTAMRNDPYGTERRLPEDTAAIVTAPFRADITYSTNIKEAVQSMHQNFINVNSMQDFLAALGAQMGGTWTMRPADGKFDFTFTENEQPVL